MAVMLSTLGLSVNKNLSISIFTKDVSDRGYGPFLYTERDISHGTIIPEVCNCNEWSLTKGQETLAMAKSRCSTLGGLLFYDDIKCEGVCAANNNGPQCENEK